MKQAVAKAVVLAVLLSLAAAGGPAGSGDAAAGSRGKSGDAGTSSRKTGKPAGSGQAGPGFRDGGASRRI
ncbi:hypothetical protein I8J29_17985 [Paenibacillus sp. MWE-103]|uniref:Uncharacterized protein n=1 Tax=Paenibacillus artemisiicola TaxID=1172618 RepID=A0ABS3WCT0_9BACL|nr:hypothetical protein [Paenibacillus artemisiicola]MBO7746103.1 hypothetical protein [Paenibacillus artemisiicola]